MNTVIISKSGKQQHLLLGKASVCRFHEFVIAARWANHRACDGHAQQGQRQGSHQHTRWPHAAKATMGKSLPHAATAMLGKSTACAGGAIKITITRQWMGVFDGGGIG